MSHRPHALRGKILLVSFEGWTDAGNAATDAVRYFLDAGAYARRYEVDSELYLDYQFTRPRVTHNDEGDRTIEYPEIVLYEAEPTGERARATESIHLLIGAEPARRWRQFTREIMAQVEELGITGIVLVGSLLADTPHTRPIDVHTSSDNAVLQRELDIEASDYEGPVGLLSVIAEAAEMVGIPALSIWASVPHYAHGAPSPKAALALVNTICDLTGARIDLTDLEVDAGLWQTTLDGLAADDEDLSAYISQLEEARDRAALPRASGDSIAAEIEKYLRRKDDPRGNHGI